MTTGIDQLSLNLSVTRSPGFSGLSSVLLWSLTGLAGWITVGGFFLLMGCLDVAIGGDSDLGRTGVQRPGPQTGGREYLIVQARAHAARVLESAGRFIEGLGDWVARCSERRIEAEGEFLLVGHAVAVWIVGGILVSKGVGEGAIGPSVVGQL